MSHTGPEQTPLIKAPKSRGPVIAAVVVVLALVVGGLVWLLNRGGDDAAEDGGKLSKVVLGTVGASDPYWETFKEAARKEGIDLEIKDFAEYPLVNPALSEGEIQVNQFQHIIYLADYNVANDDDLVPVGSTAIYPLGLYSQKYQSADEIPAGETVAVPDDDTNLARGLLVLQSAGLISLQDGGSPFSTLADIYEAASSTSASVENGEPPSLSTTRPADCSTSRPRARLVSSSGRTTVSPAGMSSTLWYFLE